MKLLTPKNVADMLQVSQATISRMCTKTGGLPHIVLRKGRRKKVIRFRQDEVERWLRSRTLSAAGRAAQIPEHAEFGDTAATENADSAQGCETESESRKPHPLKRLVPR